MKIAEVLIAKIDKVICVNVNKALMCTQSVLLNNENVCTVYKPTIFGSFLTFKLWGSAYMRVMPHSQSQHDGYQSANLTV